MAQRKRLDDDAAAFVFGSDSPPAEPPATKQETTRPKSSPRKPAAKKPTSKPPVKQTKARAIDKLMQTTEQERQVRITVDLAKSQHSGLTIASAQLGKSKADIIRALLEDFLADFQQ